MRPPLRGRGGFTLVEVMVALVVLAIGAAGVIQLMGQGQQQNGRRRMKEAALRIAANEIQRARSSGIWSIPAVAAPTRVDATGAPDAAGPYRVSVVRTTQCDPAAARPDDPGTAGTGRCDGAIARIDVTVEYLEAAVWTTRAQRTLIEAGENPGTGTWTPAATP
jgi:type II secretion system protein I